MPAKVKALTLCLFMGASLNTHCLAPDYLAMLPPQGLRAVLQLLQVHHSHIRASLQHLPQEDRDFRICSIPRR